MNARNLLFTVAVGGGLLAAVEPAFAQTWTPTSAPANNWFVASSADGSKLVAAGYGAIYTSPDSGTTWISNNVPGLNGFCVTSSADGTRLFAGSAWAPTNFLFASTNSGQTWSQLMSAPEVRGWVSLASAADGTKLVAAVLPTNGSLQGSIYTSPDSGTTWVSNNLPAFMWSAVASSADGTRLIAVSASRGGPVGLGCGGGPIYTSTNSGAGWASNNVRDHPWLSVACSADGTKLAVATGCRSLSLLSDRCIWRSPDAGATWSPTSAPQGPTWTCIASSADGTRLVAGSQKGNYSPTNSVIYTSTNSGATWVSNTVRNLDPGWSSLASSADGGRLVAGSLGSAIYTAQATPAPSLNITPSAGNLTLAWIVPSMKFVLQQNSDLRYGGWSDVAGTPALNLTNLQYQFSVPPANSPSFYRLVGR